MSPSRRQHEWIKMQLRLSGSSLAEVARELGVAKTTVTAVCQGHRRSRRIKAAIAAKLDLPAEALWPESTHADAALVAPEPGRDDMP